MLDYDVTTGIGDVSFVGYTGGACNGAAFDSTGATQTSSGTENVVVSENGNRIDSVLTALTLSPTNSVGGFSISSTGLRQIQVKP